MERIRYPEHLVFGLDIGTRSIVGTVGYKSNKDDFVVVAQVSKEHKTRAMLDGQIHDIQKVTDLIAEIKEELEAITHKKLSDVCIAAAGRVLKTLTVKADYEFANETIVNQEHVHSLNLLGVEKAYNHISETENNGQVKFYCVGYTAVKYYLNEYAIMSLEGHKAGKISVELLATFLPEEVIDSLYVAVEKAGLYVVNLTLEPIAAMNVAIPVKFRLLNIALVDVGAGTSDICITKEGTITAYGMIPFAGDEITEVIVNNYLVDFNTAEQIKTACLNEKTVTFKDIMGISHEVSTDDVIEKVTDIIEKITKSISDKIIELNGGKPVSAVFIVGGGGKIPFFDTYLSEHLGIMDERVALRGEEVLENVQFLQKEIKKDSTLVTPIGICMSYYEEKNNFIFVNVNGERVKLYNNNKLTVSDAAIQVGFPNEHLFPRRGKPLEFYVNNTKRMVRGEFGESAVIKINGKEAGIGAAIEQNDKIELIPSSVGPDAQCEVGQLTEYSGFIEFMFNDHKIVCPKFVSVNNELVTEYYSIKEGDNVEILNYYTLKQVFEFMDLDFDGEVYVNNILTGLEEKIYDQFTIQYNQKVVDTFADLEIETFADDEMDNFASHEILEKEEVEVSKVEVSNKIHDINILVNGDDVVLTNKEHYILVDIFDVYYFDLTVAKGSAFIVTVNGLEANFTDEIFENDFILLYWRD